MFVKTLNAIDFPMLYGFLDTFCRPDFYHHATKSVVGSKCPIGSFQGIASAATFWYGMISLSPDSVAKLVETNVHLQSGTNRSKIVSTFRYEATKIFDNVDGEESNVFSQNNYDACVLSGGACACSAPS